nr:DUF5753 domain-containing protein [Streptomyces sp. NBC_00886]
MSFEADAKDMRTYESTLIPGLLQTAAYARPTIAVISMTSTDGDVDALVEVHMARQPVLGRPEPLEPPCRSRTQRHPRSVPRT